MYLMANTSALPKPQENDELRKVEGSIRKLLEAERLTGTHYYDTDIKKLMARRDELRAETAKGAR